MFLRMAGVHQTCLPFCCMVKDHQVKFNPFSKCQLLDSSKLKKFGDNTFKSDKNCIKFSKRLENTAGKGEISHYEQFLLFQVFSKGFYYRHVKSKACLGNGYYRYISTYYSLLSYKNFLSTFTK